MPDRIKILFIGDYCRADYLSMLSDSKDYVLFSFLYYASAKEERNKVYKAYGEAVYWENYKHVFALLERVRPAKVIFLYIESYNQVVLNLACRQLGILTYQLEHGLRADYVAGFDAVTSPKAPATFSQKVSRLLSLVRNAPYRIRNRLFLYNSIQLLPPADAAFVRDFIRVRKNNNFIQTIRRTPSAKRTTDIYISFSKKIYNIIKKEDALPATKKVYYIGVPYFDHLATIRSSNPIKALLFIDQPLVEKGLLGWNIQSKTVFAEQLATICQQLGLELLIKPHPLQDLAEWRSLHNAAHVKFVTDNEVTTLAPALRMVLGFYSTYLLPFAALAHTAVITYENHPTGKLMLSEIMTEAGVAKAIFDLQELIDLLPRIQALQKQQMPYKAAFTEDWLYKFDGKSGERLRQVLLL